ncbi:rhomboid-related protein 4 [Callorhinchus milii]|uniref:Rhomboid domain containing 1 n=1 Tax=Callorhinchus milii TaxID=7868 RepID=A0A4W3HTT8_CALMI|nr:rhomboid-related protein 4 [Callorhinchus milii]XP_042195311.1 rhomboid-related protein 4 [Callorhinchus milii]|eukprot:gi/632933960/ref/XP_007894454.1/ PREDICTED: rhomboid-related protein 4 [Callorhinchus milii]
MRPRQRGLNLGLILLATEIFRVGIENVPPVTLLTLGLNIFLFLSPMKPLLGTCISLHNTWYKQDWSRLFYSPFHHADDWHLYFNMVSMLWKGLKLERKLGSNWFAYMLLVFSVVTGLTYLLLETVLVELTKDSSYTLQCSVGFSGVLFALKVVNNYYDPWDISYIMGVPIASQYACWIELVLIHLISPGTSFVGHLAGIIVGIMYTKGPLRYLMKLVGGIFSTHDYARSQVYYRGQGYAGYRTADNYGPYENDYSRGLSEEEQLNEAIWDSLRDNGGSHNDRRHYNVRTPRHLSEEEMRQQRLNRFAR